MFKVWSADDDPGLIQAIMTILALCLFKKESRSTIVNFEALNGTCELPESKALIHSFKAKRLLLISAPSLIGEIETRELTTKLSPFLTPSLKLKTLWLEYLITSASRQE